MEISEDNAMSLAQPILLKANQTFGKPPPPTPKGNDKLPNWKQKMKNIASDLCMLMGGIDIQSPADKEVAKRVEKNLENIRSYLEESDQRIAFYEKHIILQKSVNEEVGNRIARIE